MSDTESPRAQKLKKKLKLKKVKVAADADGGETTVRLMQERKKIAEEDFPVIEFEDFNPCAFGLDELSVDDLKLIADNECSIKKKKAKKSSGARVKFAVPEVNEEEIEVEQKPEPSEIKIDEDAVNERKHGHESTNEEKKAKKKRRSEDEARSADEEGHHAKLKTVKEIVAEEAASGKQAEGKVFESLEELLPQLERFGPGQEQHLRRWLKKLILNKRLTKALRNEACDAWKIKADVKWQQKKQERIAAHADIDMDALVQMEGTLDDVKEKVTSLREEGKITYKEAATIINHWKKREARRIERHQKFVPTNMQCLNCREYGHIVAQCPNKNTNTERSTGFCFKCGKTGHDIYHCPKKDKIEGFPHASCFICKEKGHLSRECTQNDRGIYINGGSCDLCGSKMHLVRNCDRKALKEQAEEDRKKREAEAAAKTEARKEARLGGGRKRPAASASTAHVTGDDDNVDYFAGDDEAPVRMEVEQQTGEEEEDEAPKAKKKKTAVKPGKKAKKM